MMEFDHVDNELYNNEDEQAQEERFWTRMTTLLLTLAIVGATAVATRACILFRSWTMKSSRSVLIQTEPTHTGLRSIVASPRFWRIHHAVRELEVMMIDLQRMPFITTMAFTARLAEK